MHKSASVSNIALIPTFTKRVVSVSLQPPPRATGMATAAAAAEVGLGKKLSWKAVEVSKLVGPWSVAFETTRNGILRAEVACRHPKRFKITKIDFISTENIVQSSSFLS